MEDNIALLNLVLLITSALLFILILFKEKKFNKKINYYKKQNNRDIYLNNTSSINEKIIMDKIVKLELEVLKLKEENSKIIKQYKKSNITDSNFKQVLNYNFLKEKNNDIINLYKQGKPKEEIAKKLNKSIREIEMVINLVRSAN